MAVPRAHCGPFFTSAELKTVLGSNSVAFSFAARTIPSRVERALFPPRVSPPGSSSKRGARVPGIQRGLFQVPMPVNATLHMGISVPTKERNGGKINVPSVHFKTQVHSVSTF